MCCSKSCAALPLHEPRVQPLTFPMASNLSATEPTPEIASSERVMWLLIWFFGILPVIWLLPVVYSWLRRRWAKTAAVARIQRR